MEKLSIDYIKNEIKKEGYFLISKEYHNCMSYIEIQCPIGHKYRTKWNKFQQGRRCNICASTKRKTLTYIKKIIESYEFILLSTKYNNCNTKLEVVCKNNHKYITTWDKFRLGYRCSICSGNDKKSFKYIKENIEKYGYKILTQKEDYKNTKTVLTGECDKGHYCKIRWADFNRGIRCSECRGLRKKSFQYIKNAISKENCILLSKEYINSSTPLIVKCDNNHIFHPSWRNFKNGSRCPKCSMSSISKASQIWLDSLQIPNKYREFPILTSDGKKYIADAYDPKNNTIYEYFGRFWHGHPDYYQSDKINPICKKSFGELYINTITKIKRLEEDGYNMIYEWGP